MKIMSESISSLYKKNTEHDHKQFADKNKNILLNKYNKNEFE